MKFRKAPDLWKEHNLNALRLGLLKLQPGQLVWCGGERPAVYVGLSPAGVVWAVHWVEGVGYDWQKFHKLRATLKANQGKAALAVRGAA